jgi:hypothetical protein
MDSMKKNCIYMSDLAPQDRSFIKSLGKLLNEPNEIYHMSERAYITTNLMVIEQILAFTTIEI